MSERHPSDLPVIDHVSPFRVSWDGRDIAGEYREHRFSASFHGRDPQTSKGYWLMWHYWPTMPLDSRGFAVHPMIAPNGRACTGVYRTLNDVRNAIRAIVFSIDNPNVVAFRPRAEDARRRATRADGPLVA
ncbi:MAG: hypothetical protein U1F33_13650 [Alphaproteobacteria bacterium]